VEWSGFVTMPPSENQQAAWRRRWPSANRAVLLERAGVLVVDCDGDGALSEATGHGLPPAIVASTGRGRHYFYAAPRDVAGKTTTKRGRSAQIDVLAGGLVTIPPSRHRSGRAYEWIVAPSEKPLGEPPSWAVRWLEEAATAGDVLDIHLPKNLPAV